MKTAEINENKAAELAFKFAQHTYASFFLTGKAGTGKTTFLRKLVKTSKKNTIVVAPTGVAAIHAGGSTIHSMFSFPLKVYIPSHDFVDANIAVNKPLLINHLKYNDEKRKLFENLELLVIDEVSMVRADLLDAIDFSLKYVRSNRSPFGGVQVIAIGDLFQLAPIINKEEWALLQKYYSDPYFFNALSWQASDAFIIELEKVYRQSDDQFIGILNEIRSGSISLDSLKTLNERYRAQKSTEDEKAITLTTHNRKADQINLKQLEQLDTKPQEYHAKIDGHFSNSAFPVEEKLTLKKGAKVMFTRNDTEDNKYYNGKIATIEKLDDDEIWVRTAEEDKPFKVEPVKWENKKYVLDKKTNDIEQETLGTFIQYPLRLAWAITIHKSQGLTFEKAVIDIENAFATGQAYVALSRCKSLEGIWLDSKIRKRNILADQRILNFLGEKDSLDTIEAQLALHKKKYALHQLQRTFDFHALEQDILSWQSYLQESKFSGRESAQKLARNILKKLRSLRKTERKFQQYFEKNADQLTSGGLPSFMKKKVDSAIHYFTEEIYENIIVHLHQYVKKIVYKRGVKKHVQKTDEVLQSCWALLHQLYHASFFDQKLYSGNEKKPENQNNADTTSLKKANTYELTLDLYHQGMDVKEIALKRELKESTIHGHLSKWVEEGELEIDDLLDGGKLSQLLPYFEEMESVKLTDIKNEIPFDTTYVELKYARAYYNRESSQK